LARSSSSTANTAADLSIVESVMGRIFRLVAKRNAHRTPIEILPSPNLRASSISSRLNLKLTVKFRPFPSGRRSLTGISTLQLNGDVKELMTDLSRAAITTKVKRRHRWRCYISSSSQGGGGNSFCVW
jgi:hypothetical protein